MKTSASVVVRLAAASLALAPNAAAQGLHISRVTTRIDGRQIGATNNFPENCAFVDSISDDGRFAVFFEYIDTVPPNFASYETRVLDRADGSQVPITLGAGGAQLDDAILGGHLTGDGSRIFFESWATNLPGGVSLPNGGLFVLQRSTGVVSRVSQGLGGADPDDGSYFAAASPDGRFVAFFSAATNLVAGDTNGNFDAFLADLQTGAIVRTSVASGGLQSAGESQAEHVSSNGRYAVFDNNGDDLAVNDNNSGAFDVYLRDLQLGTTELVSVTPSNVAGDSDSYGSWVSDDGRRVAFISNADDLVPGDLGGFNDLFVRDRQTGTTTMVRLTSSGAQANSYILGTMSSNGRWFAFHTDATNIVAGDANGKDDLFIRDLTLNTTQLLSRTPLGGQVSQFGGPLNGPYAEPRAVSSNGRFVAFVSSYSDLVEGDTNEGMDGFIVDRASTVGPVTTYCPAKTTSIGCLPVMTCSGEPRATGLDSFYVTATQVLMARRGAFIWNTTSAATPFGGGLLCVASPYHLEPVASGTYGGTSGPCNQGQFLFKVSQSFLAAHGLTPGTTMYGQFLSRDSGYAPPNNIGLTDAITFTVGP